MTDSLTNPFNYFTTWSLLISYSIFIWTILLGVPKWLFLFAACLLTTTSILGTFFLVIPSAQIEATKKNTYPGKIILEDTLTHTGPLVLFLFLFNFLSKKIVNDKPKIIIKKLFILEGYHKIIMVLIIVVLSYLGYIKFEQIYYYDYFTLIILSASIFVTSYQIYSKLL